MVNINHKNTHINRIQIKENKQLNIQQKQNYPDSVTFYNSQPGNKVGLFYNGPVRAAHGPTITHKGELQNVIYLMYTDRKTLYSKDNFLFHNYNTGWLCNTLVSINIVALHRAWLLLGWVTVCWHVKLSLPSLQGRLIKYQPDWG